MHHIFIPTRKARYSYQNYFFPDRELGSIAAVQAEWRKEASVARGIVVALPFELGEVLRQELVLAFSRCMALNRPIEFSEEDIEFYACSSRI